MLPAFSLINVKYLFANLYSSEFAPKYVFTASELSGYNPEHWPYEMHFDADETLMFRDYIQDGNREKIVLATRKQVITVTAEKHKLEVGIERVAE